MANLTLSSDVDSILAASDYSEVKEILSLDAVDNTADTEKPVSTAQATAIAAKADASALTSHTSNTSNPHSVTKAQVGLGSADNTADSAKPISTAQQTALDLKAPLTSPALTGTPTAPTASAGTNTTQIATTAFVATAVSNLVSAAPGALDTLDELAAALNDDASFAATVTTALAGKASTSHTHTFSSLTSKPTTVGGYGITDGYAVGGTDVSVADGGTGASTTAGAWANLTVSTVTSGGTAIDWAAGPSHSRTLAADTTFTFSNAADGQTINVAVTNTASNYTVTWPTVKWSGGAPPTQTVGAVTDVLTFTKIGSVIYGTSSQNHS